MKTRDYLFLSVFILLTFIYSKGVFVFFASIFLTLITLNMTHKLLTDGGLIRYKNNNKKDKQLIIITNCFYLGMLGLLLYVIQDVSFEKVSSLVFLGAGIGFFQFVLTVLIVKICS